MVAWGDDYYGQTNVPADLTNAVAIAAGSVFSIALRNDGTVAAWGDTLNTFGELDVPPDLNGVVGIAAGSFHALAVQTNGMVVGWGNDNQGEGNPPVSLNLTNAIAVAAGSLRPRTHGHRSRRNQGQSATENKPRGVPAI